MKTEKDKWSDDEFLRNILIYACGSLEKATNNGLLSVSNNEILTDDGRSLYQSLIEAEYSPDYVDFAVALIGILESMCCSVGKSFGEICQGNKSVN